MSAPPLTQQTPIQNVVIDPSTLSSPSSQSLWDRISRWVSENKAAVYTVAGVAVVVTGAGVIYYLSDSKKASQESPAPRKSKNQRRKEKKAEEERKVQEEQAAGTGI
jgi:mitochondrial import receptor subunit TOM70